MKIINYFETFIKRVLCCFALIVLAFCVIGSILNVQATGKVLAVSQLFGFFLFSVLYSISVEISKLFKKNAVLRGAICFILSLASFVAVFFLNSSFSVYLSEKQNPAYSIIVITFAYVIIYVVCSLIGALFNLLTSRISNSQKEYENVYDIKQ